MRYLTFGILVALLVVNAVIILSNRGVLADYVLFVPFTQQSLAMPFLVCTALGVITGMTFFLMIWTIFHKAKERGAIEDILEEEESNEPITILGDEK